MCIYLSVCLSFHTHIFETVSHCVALVDLDQVDLKPTVIHLPVPPECRGHRCALRHLAHIFHRELLPKERREEKRKKFGGPD